MHEYLSRLGAGARVLDVGCRTGSFAREATAAKVVRVDLEATGADGAVRADAARLPFATGVFDLVVANHSVEHFARLRESIEEMARVLKPGGVIYVTVPDASTWSDGVYRWLGRGGGHVNPFRSVGELPGAVEAWTGLRLSGWKVLYAGYSFLNGRNCARMPRRSYLFGGGAEWAVYAGVLAARWCDARFGTRLGVYGWAYVFGAGEGFDPRVAPHVCIRCGNGETAEGVARNETVRGVGPFRRYRCDRCGCVNPLVG